MAERFELVVSPIQEIPAITSNIEALKDVLEVELKKYQQLVVTEDGLRQAKDDRANLNKLKKNISEERIAQRRMFLKPFEEFETKCKQIEKLIDDTAYSIDSQVKAFEEREKAEKRKEIAKIYLDNIGDYGHLIPLENIFDNRWLNKSFKLKDVEVAIRDIRNNADIALKKIKEFDSEFENQLIHKYFENLNMNDVYAEKIRLDQQKKALEELEKKKRAEELAKEIPLSESEVEEDYIQTAEVIAEETQELMAQETVTDVETITMVFKVVCTRDQLTALGEYMRSHGIKYGRA